MSSCHQEVEGLVRSKQIVLADLLDVLQSLPVEDLLVVEEELMVALECSESEEEDSTSD